MTKRIVAVAAAVIAGIGGCTALLTARPAHDVPRSSPARPVWTTAAWPFPTDQWGDGWAFQCRAADCGVDVVVYLRPKIGFCNCKTGVADDEELDRVADLDLIGGDRTARGPGRPIAVQWMNGRSRGYQVGAPAARAVLSLAFNNRCDVIVATVVAGDEPVAQEAAVLDFLNGDVVQHWAEAVLGL